MSSDRSNLLGALLESLLESAGEHGGAVGLAALFYYGSLVEYLHSTDFLGFVWGDLAKFFGFATIVFLAMLMFISFIVPKIADPILARALRRISNPKKRENWEGGIAFSVVALVIAFSAVGCLWCWTKMYASDSRTEDPALAGALHTKDGPARRAEPPMAKALPQPPPRPNTAVVSLGNFSDEHYQVELWRDDSSSGEVLGRISLFPHDVSKNPFVGELSSIVWDVNAGQLQFTANLSFGVVSFDGILTDNGLEGRFSVGDDTITHAVFRQMATQYEQHYEARQNWDKDMAKLLACCGPG